MKEICFPLAFKTLLKSILYHPIMNQDLLHELTQFCIYRDLYVNGDGILGIFHKKISLIVNLLVSYYLKKLRFRASCSRNVMYK